MGLPRNPEDSTLTQLAFFLSASKDIKSTVDSCLVLMNSVCFKSRVMRLSGFVLSWKVLRLPGLVHLKLHDPERKLDFVVPDR